MSDPVAYELRAHYELLPPDQPGRGLSIWWTQSGRLVDSIAIYEGGVEGGGVFEAKYLMALEASEKRLIETKFLPYGESLWARAARICAVLAGALVVGTPLAVDVWVVFELDDDELRFRESGGYVRARQIHGRFPDVWRRWVGGNELSHADSPSASEEKLVAALYDESLFASLSNNSLKDLLLQFAE